MNLQSQIETKLGAALKPVLLQVENESHMHAVPKNSETHFKVVIVSPDFEGLRVVARHQRVYQVLTDELKGGVHALALHTYTEPEWAERHAEAPDSPKCHGGSKQG